MLISKTAIVKWNPRNYKHYVDLGYKYTKMGDEFEVKVNDLTNGSSAIVECECEYCHKPFKIIYSSYIPLKKKKNHKDCCGSPECTGKKAKESLLLLYGTDNCRKIPGVNEKIAETNIKKYGCENPFGSKDIIKKLELLI